MDNIMHAFVGALLKIILSEIKVSDTRCDNNCDGELSINGFEVINYLFNGECASIFIYKIRRRTAS